MLITLGHEAAGQRLDHVLAMHMPEVGLRGRRRAIALGLVSINGKPARASSKARIGDQLEILPIQDKDFCGNLENDSLASSGVEFLGARNGYCFFYKPRGMHTVSLAGKNDVSLESLAHAIVRREYPDMPGPRLLQRLDFGTSGLVCAALGAEAASALRSYEKNGLCHKYYLALLEGALPYKINVARSLDLSGRKKVKVLGKEADKISCTCFEPLHICQGMTGIKGGGPELTLAVCVIQKGQRHQIRAHAACMGHPLYGDSLYGGAETGTYYLEHFALKFPGTAVYFQGGDSVLPLLPLDSEKAFKSWLQKNHAILQPLHR